MMLPTLVVQETNKLYRIIKKKLKDTQAYSLDTVHQFDLVAGSVSSAPVLAK